MPNNIAIEITETKLDSKTVGLKIKFSNSVSKTKIFIVVV
jgi:hypothetical protein